MDNSGQDRETVDTPVEMEMVPLIALLLSAPSEAPSCSLIRPVAADAASARRLAEAVLRNMHSRRALHEQGQPDRPYVLKVMRAQADPNSWEAFQDLDEKDIRGGGGLEFRIDRCTGAISDMHYGR